MGTLKLLFFMVFFLLSVLLEGMDHPQQTIYNNSVVSSGGTTPSTVGARLSSRSSDDDERRPLISFESSQTDQCRVLIQPDSSVKSYEVRSDISKKMFVLGVLNNSWKAAAAGTFIWYLYQQGN